MSRRRWHTSIVSRPPTAHVRSQYTKEQTTWWSCINLKHRHIPAEIVLKTDQIAPQIITKTTSTGYFQHQNVYFWPNFCFSGPKTADFWSWKSYNLLNISIKTTFSGDVGVQHHPDITLNDTRSAPYHKGLAKRVMLVRSKNKNFLVEIFLLTMSELVQNTSHFQLVNVLFTSRSCVETTGSWKKITRSCVENMSNRF